MNRAALTLLSTTAALACIASASDAEASGFGTARFGGEHGHPMTDEPTAIYYNPAGITQKQGIHVMVDGAIAYRLASYTKSADPRTGLPMHRPSIRQHLTLSACLVAVACAGPRLVVDC